MGIIRAAINAVSGGLADSWGEVIEPAPMGDSMVMVPGVRIANGKSQNTKGTADTVSNGSVIHVYNEQCMLLIDGGKIVDFTAEPGYYQVSNSSMPSLFCGQFGDSLKETFSRIKYGGVPSQKQLVFYINLAEVKNIKFGTPNAVNYFDNFYNSELFIRAHGTYSVKVTNFLKFYEQVIPKAAIMEGRSVDFQEINQQYGDEFIEALAAAINQYSADGNRISFITSKSRELGKYMADILDSEWDEMRGMQVQSVGIKVSYDPESQALINMRNKGAMLSDAAVQQGYVAGAFHPAFKEICDGKIYLDRVLNEIKEKQISKGNIEIEVSPKYISALTGQKRCNIIYLESIGYKVKIVKQDTLKKYDVNVRGLQI